MLRLPLHAPSVVILAPRNRRGWAARLLGIVAVCLALDASRVAAQAAGEPTEYRVKAAFLYHFTKFVEWPTDAFGSPTAPLEICIVGTDPFGDAIDQTVQGKTVDGRAIAVRRHARDANLTGCHILFLGAVDRTALVEILTRVRGVPVLVVGETPGLAGQGGTIRFFIENSRIRFEINQEAAERSRLRISSKLLSLARLVPHTESK